MSQKRLSHDKSFKAKVALEAIRGEMTIGQISSKYKIHANMINRWKKQALSELPDIFADQRKKESKMIESEHKIDELHKTIGELTVENDWLKKKCLELNL